MGKFLKIKWQGRAGQGVVTASVLMAEILALDGKFVQAFPEFVPQQQRPSISCFNRISQTPIRTQAEIDDANIAIIMDVRLLSAPDVKAKIADDAAYFVNTSYHPDFIKEKLHLADNRIYTLDADKIAREELADKIGREEPGELGGVVPNIPLMTIVMDYMKAVSIDIYRERLKELLSARLSPEKSDANLRTIDRAIKEAVKL